MSVRTAGWLRVGLLLLTLLGAAGPALAQVEPGPPGPWVVDVRGTTLGLPNDGAFLPGLGAGAVVPGRGFGLDAGARWIWRSLGPSRLGLGVDATWVRGTTPELPAAPRVVETFVRVAPDLSFNFGSRNGWSYLSTGVGLARIAGRTISQGVTTELPSSGALLVMHGGAGARWFMTDHMAVGFDLRLHRLSAGDRTPSTVRFAASVGLSLR